MAVTKKIIIIGLGNIGFTLSHLIALKTLEYSCNINKLTLIDNDILEEHNLPYGLTTTIDKDLYINYPKIYAVKDQLLKINPKLELECIMGTYPSCAGKIKNKKNNDIYIDCRDDLAQDSKFYLKICSEGPYSKLIFYPKKIESSKKPYTIKPSKYYTLLTLTSVIEKITNIDFNINQKNEQKIYVINYLLDGEFNEI